MRADAREKRAALVDAAWTLFAERGPDVSLRSVAGAAGVGIATLYRHFPTREDLMIGVISEMVDRVSATIDRHAEGWNRPQEAEKTWRALAHDIADLGFGAVALQTIAVVPEDGEVWRATADCRARLTERYADLLRTAASFGLVNGDVAPWRFHLGLAAIALAPPDRVDQFAPGQSDWMIDVFLKGLRP
jgi:AcrR family transcriptional regulator